MPVDRLTIGAPFFEMRFVRDEDRFLVSDRAIVLNLGSDDIRVEAQALPPLASVIIQDCAMKGVVAALILEGFEPEDDAETMEAIRAAWPSAFELRGEDRLRGVEHYMSPKAFIGQIGFTLYHSASVPLKVGLHRDHPFCPVPGFREVHTQILGLGKMQQAREQDTSTIYLEEIMAPGMTHRPMYDADGNYPWHQFETITPSVFLAVEMLPEGVARLEPQS